MLKGREFTNGLSGLAAPFCLVISSNDYRATFPDFTYSGYGLQWQEITSRASLICPTGTTAKSGEGADYFFEGFAVYGDRIASVAKIASQNLTPSELKRSLRGSFTFLRAKDNRIVIGHDTLGLGQIYIYSTSDKQFISNEPSLIIDILKQIGSSQPPLTPAALVDIVAHTGMTREDGPYEGMRRLPIDRTLYIQITPDSISLTELRCPIFLERCSRIISYEDAKLKVADDIIGNVRAIRSHFAGASIIADLSGGRDSRKVLAACIAAGVHRDFIFSTRYSYNNADTTVAMELAETYGLELCRENLALDGGRRELMARSIVRLAGLRIAAGVHALKSNPLGVVSLSGGCGELTRIFYPGKCPPTVTLDESDLSNLNVRLFRPLWRPQYLTKKGKELIFTGTKPDITSAISNRADDVIYFFYLRYRNRYHFGLQSRVLSGVSPILFPLYSAYLIDLNFGLSAELRRTDAASLDLIRTFEPSLSLHRFAHQPVDARVASWLSMDGSADCLVAAQDNEAPRLNSKFKWKVLYNETPSGYPWQTDGISCAKEVVDLVASRESLKELLDIATLATSANLEPMNVAETLWQTLQRM